MVLLSCNEGKQNTIENSELNVPVDSIENINTEITNSQKLIWDVDYENKTMRRILDIDSNNISVDSIITALNSLYPKIPLRKVKVEGDTLITEITNSLYLTQSMGSSGPAEFFAQAILNLTAVPTIKFVRINFEEGDHASPGIWSRSDFSDVRIIK